MMEHQRAISNRAAGNGNCSAAASWKTAGAPTLRAFRVARAIICGDASMPYTEPVGPTCRINVVWFSFPVFEYVNLFRHTEGSLMAREGHTIIHEHLRQVLIDMIADEVSASVPRPQSGAGSVPPELLVQYVAGTFILVLNWWVESKSTLSPREADDVFLSMVLPTLTALPGD